MKDAAAKIAENIRAWWVGKGCVEPSAKLSEFAEKRIRSAIRRAVKAERERCCGIVAQSRLRNFNADRKPQFVCDDIITAINTTAKKRPSKRKGRR